MRRYRNKYNQINTTDSEPENIYPSSGYPSYQISQEFQHKQFPTGYEKSHHMVQKIQSREPNNINSKISSKSEKYYKFVTEESVPRVNFEIQNTAKKYMNKRVYTPNRMEVNNNRYISELREEYSNPMTNSRVNIRKKVYRNKTPDPYRAKENQELYNEEEFLDNYGFHETKDIKNKGHVKYDSITHITGYSNLIPLNRLKQCGRFETYNYERNEQDNKPTIKSAIEKVRQLQRGKREYDEFMRKLNTEENEDKIEQYKKEQIRQQEIREAKIRMERINQERIKEERIKQERIKEEQRKEKLRQEKIRIERMKKEEELRKEKIKKEQIRQQEKIKQEKAKNEIKQKTTSYKKIVINTQGSSNARSDSVKKQFKAHSGKYTYKENINEDINNYRNNANYNKEQKNVARKETIYKNKTKKETNKSYSKLPINNVTTSYSRNHSSKNLKIISDKEDTKNQSYLIKSNKTTITTTRNSGRKNSYRSNNTNINTDKYKNKNVNYVSNYTKQSYISNTSYSNINKNVLPNNKISNNYKRSIKVAEKTTSLNYPNQHIKVDTYGPNYKGEPYHRDYVNIESVNHGKIANHIHTGLSKDGQYLISMTSAQKISDENEALYEMPEKNVEEIISTVRERKKNLGDNYAFYESKHLQKPDNSSYTIHKRFGERTIFGKEKYETKKVRHYKVKRGQEEKYYNINDNDMNYNDNYIDENNYNREINMIEYGDHGYNCTCGKNENIDAYENVDYNYSPDSPGGEQEEYNENRVEEYNYESY